MTKAKIRIPDDTELRSRLDQEYEDAYFGQFEFDFESSGEYTADMLEASAMQVYIKDGEIIKVSGYDI